MKLSLRLLVLAVVAAAGLLSAPAQAQYGVTSSGTFGTRTVGGQSSYSNTNTGNASLQQAGIGSLGGTGTTGGGSTGGVGIAGDAATLGGTERFLRGNRGNAFVGSDSADTRSLVNQSQTNGQTGQGGLGGLGGGQFGGGNNQLQQLFSQFGRNGQNFQNFGQFGSTRAKQIRTPLKVGFTPRVVSSTAFTSKFQTRLGKTPGLQLVGPIRVVMEGETVVLQGKVASEADRQLAEDLAGLEPEVMQVRNELVVQPADPISPSADPTIANPATGR